MQVSPAGTYRGAIDCLLKTVRNEVRPFWSHFVGFLNMCDRVFLRCIRHVAALFPAQGDLALIQSWLSQGVTPPAVGWSAIDSVLLGSLHNYRLWLMRNGLVEDVPNVLRKASSAKGDPKRLTLTGHWLAGLLAGVTRCQFSNFGSVLLLMIC